MGTELSVVDTATMIGPVDAFTNIGLFEQLQRAAKLLASSSMVPQHFRGKTADCFLALQMAQRMRADPMCVMQNCYVVHGRPGIEAKLAIALANQYGPFRGPIQWKVGGEGSKRFATAYAVLRGDGATVEETVTMEMADAFGWTEKADSMWKKMPGMMLKYRSAMFLIRLYCPNVLLGMYATDELRDMTPDAGAIADMLESEDEIEDGEVIPQPAASLSLSDLVGKAEVPETVEPMKEATTEESSDVRTDQESRTVDAPGTNPERTALYTEVFPTLATKMEVQELADKAKADSKLFPGDRTVVDQAAQKRLLEITKGRGK